MSRTQQIKKLENGKGLQYLVDEAHRILENPIVTFDTDYNLIVHADVQADDIFWNEINGTGTYSIKSQIFFMEECFTDVVANAKKLALMKSDKLKYDRILGHIYNGDGKKVANVLMLECKQAFDKDTVAAFDALVDLLTKEIKEDKHFIEYGQKWQDAMINRLIDCNLESNGLYSPHVQNLYDGFKTNLFLAVLDVSKSKSAHMGSKHYMSILQKERKDFKYSLYGGFIVMIISTNYKTFSTQRELGRLAEFFEQENIFAGVSSCFDNLFELRRYYTQAASALVKPSTIKNRHVILHKKQNDNPRLQRI